jgi:predicted glycosyltransferase
VDLGIDNNCDIASLTQPLLAKHQMLRPLLTDPLQPSAGIAHLRRHQSCSAYLSTKIDAAPIHVHSGSIQIPSKNFIVKRRQLHVIPSLQKQSDGSVLQILLLTPSDRLINRRIHYGIKAILRSVSHFETLS